MTKTLAYLFVMIFATAPVVLYGQSTGGDFELTSSVIANGGGESAGETFELRGTMGQPEAFGQPSIGGSFSLKGGFWARGEVELTPPDDTVFSDGFENTPP